ncbi:hypothetical protein HDU99_002452 [Rhizoclosmatium hyalinum]|nr:hypothetical protein HDU99_002452 [Rhizoclosmatium hyalinum]
MFSWIPSKSRDTASRASSSTTTPWLSTIESTEHIIEGANANANAESVFSRQFKERFVLKLAEAVAVFEAQRAAKKTAEEAEDAKLAEIVGAPLAVVVAGAAGLGKSSLINAVFAVDVAEKGAGVPVTATATAFVDPTGFVKVIDTQGFTRSPSKNSNFKGEDLVHFVNEAITPNPSKPLPHVDMLWYFVDRIEDEDVKVLKSLVEKQVPFLVVIAKCDAKDLAEIETIRRQIHSVLSPQKSVNENSIEGDATIDNLIHSLELDAAIRGWDIVELRNPPNTTSGLKCMGCGSAKAVLRPLAPPNSNLNAWYCINQECIFSKDLYLKMEDTRSLKDSLTMLSSSVNALLNVR